MYNHWNLILIKNVEDIVDFLTHKVFISVSFSIANFYIRNAQVTFSENLQMKITSLKNKNIDV